ncbi:MAG: alpha/beta hydrolase [Pseudomonadota bacterium]
MLRFIFAIALVWGAISLSPTHKADAQEPQYSQYKTPENAKENWYVRHKSFKAEPFAVGDVSRFMFDGWSGGEIPVWAYVPTGVDLTEAPILIMMHGAQRNPARYLLEWAPHAEENGFVVVAPEFARKDFSGSRRYNSGNVFARNDGERTLVEEQEWTFSAIEPLFDHTVAALGSQQTGYTLYGHSAGSQFTHRYLYYKPEARVKRYLAANAGWYTLPDMSVEYPYGLNNGQVTEEALKAALNKPVLVLLGDQDIQTNSSSLRQTEEAMQQGEHRYNRGVTFMAVGKEQAEALGVEFGWRALPVAGVGHSNSGMAKAAAPFVR